MNITYDSKSFKINNKRIWISAGEVHYFRHPASEWREVLLRAKRAGLNTISTYVPWNFHQANEGVVDFTGNKDLARYIDLIDEMGMYAMLRPGPYICSEWDGGGIPSWLCAKPVKRFREDDPVYMKAVEKWFDKLIPIISSRQITRGGPVITVQNENEYPGAWDQSMISYIRKINDIFKRHKINVPILACNVHGVSKTDIQINFSTEEIDQYLDSAMILTYNHHVEVEPIYKLKEVQPDAPLLVTEFWNGEPVYWGKTTNSNNHPSHWSHHLRQARAVYEYLAAGAQLCYYMFEGGNSFGFFAGNNIVTSYASSYPVGEGGKLTDKYYAVHPANLFTKQFGNYLADSIERKDEQGIQYPEGVRLVIRDSSRGSMVFISTKSKQKEIDLTLADERLLTVHLGEVSASVIPLELEVFDDIVVDYSNLTLLIRDQARKTLILYGPAGTTGIISVNGKEINITVPRRRILHRKVDELNVIVTDEEMARRCWVVENEIVFGPDYVAEKKSDGSLDIKVSDATPDIVYLDKNGLPVYKTYENNYEEFDVPKLSPWDMMTFSIVEVDKKTGWKPLERPCSHENLGVVQGYCWYTAEIEYENKGIEKLLLTNTPNRVLVFVNGKYIGTHAERRWVRMRDEYGHPADWAFEELTVELRKGENRFIFLSDDLGHNYDIPCPVGIQGPVCLGSRMVEIEKFREISATSVSGNALDFMYSRLYRESKSLPALEFELSIEEGELAFICIHGVHSWISVNGKEIKPMLYPDSPWTMFHQIKRWVSWQIPEAVSGKSNTVRVQYVSDISQMVKENMMIYVVRRSGKLRNWHWKPWQAKVDFASPKIEKGDRLENEKRGEKDSPVVLIPVGNSVKRKGRLLTPSLFESHFSMPEGNLPVFLKIGEMQKGQIYLNDRNVGRFWKFGGTQEMYYLPRAWMKEDNYLVIFEELGFYPQDTSLVFGDSKKWTSIPLNFN